MDKVETKIFFIRHGAVTYLEDSIKDLQVSLNILGKEQAKQLTSKFTSVVKKIDKVYASTLNRTKETVDEISKKFQVSTINLSDLDEHRYNGNANKFHEEIVNKPEFKYFEGESITDSKVRFGDTIKKIVIENPNSIIVIGTHGTILSNYLIENFNLDSNYFFTLTYPDIFEIDYHKNGLPIKFQKRIDLLPNNFTHKL